MSSTSEAADLAERYYTKLATKIFEGQETEERVREHLRVYLRAANMKAAELQSRTDIAGEGAFKSNIDAQNDAVYLAEARRHYSDMIAGKSDAERLMDAALADAGASRGKLDPQGLKTADEINAEIEDGIKRYHLDQARDSYGDIKKGIGSSIKPALMDSYLKRAGKNRAALEEGVSSETIEQRIREGIQTYERSR